MLKKIAIIGPESTGKSTLSEQLAQHYNTVWCPEYAREYLTIHGTKYAYDDLLTIAKGQVELEDRYIQLAAARLQSATQTRDGLNKSPVGQRDSVPIAFGTSQQALLFIDTEMYVMKVWSEFVFGKCHQYILDQLAKRKYDLYLLCNIDLPWTADPLREYPDLERRQKLYDIYKNIMMNQLLPWVEISGDYDERLKNAILIVDRLHVHK